MTRALLEGRCPQVPCALWFPFCKIIIFFFCSPLALVAGRELRRRSRGRQAHPQCGSCRSVVHPPCWWTSSSGTQQATEGRAASLTASRSAVGSRTRVAGGLVQPGRGLGCRARAHGQSACACLACTTLYYKSRWRAEIVAIGMTYRYGSWSGTAHGGNVRGDEYRCDDGNKGRAGRKQ